VVLLCALLWRVDCVMRRVCDEFTVWRVDRWLVDRVTTWPCDELTGSPSHYASMTPLSGNQDLTYTQSSTTVDIMGRVMSLSVHDSFGTKWWTFLVHDFGTYEINFGTCFFVVWLRYMRSTISVHHYVDIGTLRENVCILCWRSANAEWMFSLLC